MNFLLVLVMTTFLFSCAQVSQSNLYWANYSTTLYNYKKDPTDIKLSLHIKEIEDIIKYSQDTKLKIPPGLQAELAFYSLKKNESENALLLLSGEVESYPESIKLVKRIQAKIKGDSK